MRGYEGEAKRLEKDLREAQSLHHHTFSQLVESGAQKDLLREENRALSQRLAALQEQLSKTNDEQLKKQIEEANMKLMQTVKERERVNWEKDDLSRQLHEAEGRQEELLTTIRRLQGQVHGLEEESSTASEGRAEAEQRTKDAEKRVKEAEKREKEAERNIRLLQERLTAQECLFLQTSESVECLGQQLEVAVAALSAVQEEARSKAEQAHRARQDAEHLSAALTYEKELNATLHNQVEGLARETATQEGKVGELQQEIRRMARDASHREKQVKSSETEVLGLKRQIGVLEGLLEEGQREVASLQDSLASQDTLRKDVRTKLQVARKEAVRNQEQVSELKNELREAHEHIEALEHQIKTMDEEREAEVGAVVERLTSSHDQSIRRLEASLLTYSRVYDHDHNQVEGLEESLAEVGEKLSEAERQLREARQERDNLARNLRQERTKRQEENRSQCQQVHRLTEEISLLKARLESVQEESSMWQKQCEDLEERHSLLDVTGTTTSSATASTTASLLAQLAKMHHQMEGLREAVSAATEEKRTAEEERGHAHEQVLSLIRECNALEEQIHRLTKEKCQLEEKISVRESDLTMAQENMRFAKKDYNMKEEELHKLRQELSVAKMEGKTDMAVNTVKQEQEERQHVYGDIQRETSELRRLLIERDTQARVTQLKITTLQRSLQDHKNEVSQLEERLHEEQTHAQMKESEMASLRTKVATLSAQLAHAQARSSSHLPTSHKMESLECKVFELKGELAAREEQLKQASERVEHEVRRNKSLQQENARVNNSHDEAMQQIAALENALTETHKGVEDSQAMKVVWETQLKSIKEEVARLMCETGQLKDCNAALHEQLSTAQSESEALMSQVRERDTQLEELQQARDLLANDAQVVVAAVRQWLHEQKLTNTKLAGKLHQQNKQILLLNTEKQFLAERNTSLQRTSHDLTLQVHDLRARLGLSLSTSTTDLQKMGKVGGVLVMGGTTSPRVMSPIMGMSPHVLPGTPTTPDTFTHLPSPHDCKLEDITSTCSSEGSGGCNVPGPDLPGSLQLGRLAQLADSLLAASRNISSRSGMQPRNSTRPVLTSTSSLGDLTSPSNSLSKSECARKTSASVGNLAAINSPDVQDRATSPISIYGNSRGFTLSRMGGLSVTPVREKRPVHPPALSNHSIEEAEDEGRCDV
ncbi:hypothetical protein Pcinc_002256 [Petrolisthes cinctipes]|uniref:Uncharacterized protein n=1 Tax=Petrolisthes cinctipes TaxID=88211 RepID=A0AAE1L2E3_PETCI|nr:hypothetical protein Pcinc_002256 [Petrolisthes cinctipes]